MGQTYILVYQNHRVVLPEGEIFVGRAMECHVRFNAATVSRRHLRLELVDGILRAENLSSTTGTLLNGKPLTRLTPVRHGDRLSLGPRELSVELVAEDRAEIARSVPTTLGTQSDVGSFAEDEEEHTRPGDLAAVVASPPHIEFHTCPRCRARVSFDTTTCPVCGHTWEAFGPSVLTHRVTVRHLTPQPVPAADVPVVYASEAMTIDAVAREIRGHGLFVPTELLDPEGTECEITILADGESALVVRGVVKAVRATGNPAAPAGLEVAFTEVGPAARAWLASRAR